MTRNAFFLLCANSVVNPSALYAALSVAQETISATRVLHAKSVLLSSAVFHPQASLPATQEGPSGTERNCDLAGSKGIAVHMELFSHMTVCAQHASTAALTCLRHDRQCSDSMPLT